MSVNETDTVVVPVQIPDTIVDDVVAELEEIGAEPSRDVVRDRVFDALEVSPEFHVDGRPVADAVADRLEAGD